VKDKTEAVSITVFFSEFMILFEEGHLTVISQTFLSVFKGHIAYGE